MTIDNKKRIEYQNLSFSMSRYVMLMTRVTACSADSSIKSNLLMADFARLQTAALNIMANNDPEVKEMMMDSYIESCKDFIDLTLTVKNIKIIVEYHEEAILYLKVLEKELMGQM